MQSTNKNKRKLRSIKPEVLCGSHRDANWSFWGTAAFGSFVRVQVSDSAVAPSCGFSSNKLKEYKPLNNAAPSLLSPRVLGA